MLPSQWTVSGNGDYGRYSFAINVCGGVGSDAETGAYDEVRGRSLGMANANLRFYGTFSVKRFSISSSWHFMGGAGGSYNQV